MEGNSGYKDYVAGLMAGIAIVITGHPFDTVKVRLLLQSFSRNTHFHYPMN